jgi:8-oxo-dGTP diphosphatase
LIRVAVGILKRGDKFLIAERPKGKPYDGYWEFPGGKLETNESGAQALKRELQEELGIDVIAAEFLFEHIHVYPDKTVFLEMWLVNEFIGEPQNKENQVLRWATLEDMHTLRLLEGNGPILEKITGLA